MTAFKKAERKQSKLKIALTGPSGSGKTYSALEMASGMGKKIALIDTENGSAALYSDRFEFDTLEIEPPYTVPKYIDAIKAAVAAGYEVCVIDSLTHAWAGEGGLLAKKESLDQRGGNSYTNWAGITKEHEAFKAILLNSDIHLICTMRSKQDYVLEVNEKGKSSPRKVGLAPIQRDGMEYEFTTVFDIAMDHHALASKDRTGLFDGQIAKISKTTGETLMKWLAGGKVVEKPAPAPAQEQPKQTPAPVVLPKASAVPGSGAYCEICNQELIYSQKKDAYYCKNFADKSNGTHSYIVASRLEEFKAPKVKEPVEPELEDIPQ